MKRDQDIHVVRKDRRDVIFTIENEETGEPRNLIGHDATWLARKGSRDPPIVALTSEDDDRLEVGGSDGTVTLRLDSELTDLDVRSAAHYLVIRGVDETGEMGSWTAATGTYTLTR